MYDRRRFHSLCLEQRGRTEGVTEEHPRYNNEGTIRLLRAQHVQPNRGLAREPLDHQAGASLSRIQRTGVFRGIEEGQVRRACSAERGNVGNEIIFASPGTEFGTCKNSDL